MDNFLINLGIVSPYVKLIILIPLLLVCVGVVIWGIQSMIADGVKSGIQQAIREESYRIGKLDDTFSELIKTIKDIDKKLDNINDNSTNTIFQLVRIKDNLDEMKSVRKEKSLF